MKKVVVVVLLLLLVGVGVWYFFGDTLKSSGIFGGNSGKPGGAMSVIIREGGNALYVAHQAGGKVVTASVVSLERSGYVVIHESRDGKAGPVIGSSALLPVGESNDVSVSLSKNVDNGTELIAELHIDNGDGVFSAMNDDPVFHANGFPFIMPFTMNSTPTGRPMNY